MDFRDLFKPVDDFCVMGPLYLGPRPRRKLLLLDIVEKLHSFSVEYL